MNQEWGHMRPVCQSQLRQYQNHHESKLNAPNHLRKAVVCKHHVWVLPHSHVGGSQEALHQGVEKKPDSASFAKILHGLGGGGATDPLSQVAQGQNPPRRQSQARETRQADEPAYLNQTDEQQQQEQKGARENTASDRDQSQGWPGGSRQI